MPHPEKSRRSPDAKRRLTPKEIDDRRRAAELVVQGYPPAMAMSVAQGRMTKNEATERLARRAEVEQLMKAHDMTRALATQVALGHAKLDEFLAKRRFDQHRGANRVRSVLDEAASDGRVWTWALFGGRKVEGKLTAITPYNVTLVPTEGAPEELHKLAFKFGHAPDDFKRLRKIQLCNKALREAPKAPAERPQERYTCSDKRFFKYVDSGAVVRATLLEGEVIEGSVAWFSRYEFALSIKGHATIVVFRHALNDLIEVADK